MRLKPTRIDSWTANAVVVLSSLAGLGCAGIANAAELAEPALTASDWPWIAVSMTLGLLGVVAYASRRRIHSVVGS